MRVLSLDLRQRIVAACDAGDCTQSQVAARFTVSLGMVKKLLAQRRRTGEIAARYHRCKGKPKILKTHQRQLRALVRKQPDLTLTQRRAATGLPCSLVAKRPVRRPKNKDDQKGGYDGKKKAHRKKNLLVTREREVIYLGPTSPGGAHDKKLAGESGLYFPPESLVLEDSDSQAYEAAGAPTLRPKKKPRTRALYPSEQALDQLLSRYRIMVEHAIPDTSRP